MRGNSSIDAQVVQLCKRLQKTQTFIHVKPLPSRKCGARIRESTNRGGLSPSRCIRPHVLRGGSLDGFSAPASAVVPSCRRPRTCCPWAALPCVLPFRAPSTREGEKTHHGGKRQGQLWVFAHQPKEMLAGGQVAAIAECRARRAERPNITNCAGGTLSRELCQTPRRCGFSDSRCTPKKKI